MDGAGDRERFPIMLVRTTRPTSGLAVTQPLGILYLAGALRRAGYRNVRLLDMRPTAMSVDALIAHIRAFEPRLLGLSCLSYELPTVVEIAARAHGIDPTIHVCLGGPLPSSMREQALEASDADSIAIGEGETSVVELADGLASKSLPPMGPASPAPATSAGPAESADPADPAVPGLLFRSELGRVQPTGPCAMADLDELPMPAWDQLDLRQYFGLSSFNFFLKHPNYMSIMTTRGCPYRCAYCHNVLGKAYRKRSVGSVMDEVHTLVEDHQICELHIIDDSFNLDLPRAKAILDEMARLDPPIALAFPNGIRADVIDEEFLVKAKAAGAYKINFAVETASPRLQKKIRKNLKLERVEEMIRIADRLDIIAHGFFMIGFPTETEAEMRQTVEFAVRSRLHTANFFVVQPFEGTDIFEMFRELQPDMVNDADQFDYYRANFEIYEIPRRRVQGIVKQAHRRFFLTPWRALALFRLLPRKRALLRGALTLAKRGFRGEG